MLLYPHKNPAMNRAEISAFSQASAFRISHRSDRSRRLRQNIPQQIQAARDYQRNRRRRAEERGPEVRSYGSLRRDLVRRRLARRTHRGQRVRDRSRSFPGAGPATRARRNRAAPQAVHRGEVLRRTWSASTWRSTERTRTPFAWSRRWPRAARAAKPHSGAAPRLAIIIDDLGNDRAAGDAVISLPFPLTVSVLPKLPFSAELAEEAYRRGDQVLLHLPMQAQSATMPPEQAELRVGMSAEQVRSTFAGMLETVPHVVGVNNHEGSLRHVRPSPDGSADARPARARPLLHRQPHDRGHRRLRRGGTRRASRQRREKFFSTTRRNATRFAPSCRPPRATRSGMARPSRSATPIPKRSPRSPKRCLSLEARGIRMVFASDLVH